MASQSGVHDRITHVGVGVTEFSAWCILLLTQLPTRAHMSSAHAHAQSLKGHVETVSGCSTVAFVESALILATHTAEKY